MQAADRVDEAPGGKVLVRCWDKDFIRKEKKWALLRNGLTPDLEDRFRKQLQAQESGTVVLWEVLDRLGHDAHDSDIAERLKRCEPTAHCFVQKFFLPTPHR